MRIVLLAPFGCWTDTYSLCHVVASQVDGLCDLGHEVQVWCGGLAGLSDCAFSEELRQAARVRIDLQTLVPDVCLRERTDSYIRDLLCGLEDFKPDAVITHDVLLQSHFIDMARAIHEIGSSVSGLWFHYLHSTPTTTVDTPVWRRTLPPEHAIIVPNPMPAYVLNAANQYAVPLQRAYGCLNPHDPRTLWRSSPLTRKIVDNHDLMSRDVVQVYPVCSTRMDAKGVPTLIRIFEHLKQQGCSVCLIVANAHANGEKERDAVTKIRQSTSLTSDELLVTSQLDDCERGVPHRTLMDLMRFSNTFIFPTLAEAGPLILLEAAAQGCVLAVNHGVVPGLAWYVPEGTLGFKIAGQHDPDYERRCADVARAVQDRLVASEAWQAKKKLFRECSNKAHARTLERIIQHRLSAARTMEPV